MAACVAWLQHATRLQELSYNVIQVNVDGRNPADPYMVCIVFFLMLVVLYMYFGPKRFLLLFFKVINLICNEKFVRHAQKIAFFWAWRTHTR